MLPTPCPINSALDLCLLPIIPSDTTADKSDSILARIAIVNAGLIKSFIIEKEIFGTENLGRAESPLKPATCGYELPIVLTALAPSVRPPACTITVQIMIAISEPGIALTYLSFQEAYS